MKKIAILLTLFLAFACKRAEKPVAPANADAKPQARGAAPAATATGTEVGAAMPDYSATNLDGSKFDLASKRDKVVLLNLWATWCGPCRYEIPELEALHAKYAARGFEVVGVSVDEGGVDAVRDFVKEQKMTYPVALDPEGKLATIFQTSVLPTSVVIDRNGRIVWKQFGAIEPNNRELTSAIEKAL